MTTITTTRPGRRLGTASVVLGLVGLAALGYAWLLSTPDVDPPNWLRVVGLVWLPVGFFGALLTGVLALGGPGSSRGVVGLLLVAAMVAAVTALQLVYGG